MPEYSQRKINQSESMARFLDTLIIPDGKILDFIDGILRNDTPEEYVRQNVEKRLIREHKYTKDQIKIEFPIKMGSGKKKADIVIFPDSVPHRQEFVKIIIECKNESVDFNNRKEGVDQLKSYMAATMNSEWGMWTNGKSKYVYRKVSKTDGTYDFEEPNDIPSKDGNIEELDRPTRNSLKRATEDNMLFTFRTCHNHIYVNEGFQKQPAFFEFLKIIFCKIVDERNIPLPLEFFASSREKNTQDGQLSVQRRISKIFEKVKKKFPIIFEVNDTIRLTPRTLAYVVGELQKYSLLDTNIDVKGKAYEEIVGSNLRGDRGEFFTPRNVVKMAIKMLSISKDDRVLDPACGTGGFLVEAMNNTIDDLKYSTNLSLKKLKVSDWSEMEKENFRNKVQEIAQNQFYGFDINPDLVRSTKMNMVMNNDGSGNILQNNSLLPPHEWSDDIKEMLYKTFGIPHGSIRGVRDIALFDVVITNPPFGTKLPIKDHSILEQFDLGHVWAKKGDSFIISDQLVGSRAPEVLFIERCFQFLKPSGKMAIVVPNSILNAPGPEYVSVRKWILNHFYVTASIQLHSDTFQPNNGTSTSVLFLRKKTEEEIRQDSSSGIVQSYNVFFAVIDKVGHDKRGNPIFKRDDEGNEILELDIDEKIIDQTIEGQLTARNLPKRKILDDQTISVAETFLKWAKAEVIQW